MYFQDNDPVPNSDFSVSVEPNEWFSPVRVALGGILLIVSGLAGYLLWQLGLDTIYYLSIGWIALVLLALWGGNAAIANLMDKAMPWESYTTRRFFMQLISSVLFSLFCINLTYYLFKINFTEYPPEVDQIIVLNIYGSLFLIPVISLHFGIYFLAKWKKAFIQTESLKQESVKSQLNSLKNHIDPHFLFNNLNILSSLIPHNNQEAQAFLENFSDVYRYVLQTRKNELSKVGQEVEFIESYAYMLEKRFQENLRIKIDISDKVAQRKFIPPLSLQLLLENVVKHNIITADKPLNVTITQENEDYLIVRNNLQRKNTMGYSAKSGLENLHKRYRFLSDKNISVIEDHDFFTVKLPLLNLGML